MTMEVLAAHTTNVRSPRLRLLDTSAPARARGRVPLRYLGSKSRLAEQIVVQTGRWGLPTVVFDLFAGMGHVSAAFANTARIVAADTSVAAATVLKWRLGVGAGWHLDDTAVNQLGDLSSSHFARLSVEYADLIDLEQRWLDSGSDRLVGDLARCYGGSPGVARMRSPGSVITAYFGSAYFGARQAMQLDALRSAIDEAHAQHAIDTDQAATALVGLLCAATHLTNAPGHFAQHFKLTGPHGASARRMMVRDALAQWKREVAAMWPAGSAGWRAKNIVVNRDSMVPWSLTAPNGATFADPPYTSSQYSRFYHVLDTIVRYDTPACDHSGRYRDDRYISSFCRKREVRAAFTKLMTRGLELAPSTFVTYPDNGLLQHSGSSIPEVAKELGVVATKLVGQPVLHAAPGSADGHRPVLEEVWRIRA